MLWGFVLSLFVIEQWTIGYTLGQVSYDVNGVLDTKDFETSIDISSRNFKVGFVKGNSVSDIDVPWKLLWPEIGRFEAMRFYTTQEGNVRKIKNETVELSLCKESSNLFCFPENKSMPV